MKNNKHLKMIIMLKSYENKRNEVLNIKIYQLLSIIR